MEFHTVSRHFLPQTARLSGLRGARLRSAARSVEKRYALGAAAIVEPDGISICKPKADLLPP